MKKVKYRNNNNYNQIYSINYKFDSISPAGKFCGTALDLIKRYNELAKEAQGNGNYVEAEVFRQYAEHYRKIVTEINERKNVRFNNRDNEQQVEKSEDKSETVDEVAETNTSDIKEEVVTEENSLVETKVKAPKKSFTVIEVTKEVNKPKKVTRTKQKKEGEAPAANN